MSAEAVDVRLDVGRGSAGAAAEVDHAPFAAVV